jgi:hypothetical protein
LIEQKHRRSASGKVAPKNFTLEELKPPSVPGCGFDWLRFCEESDHWQCYCHDLNCYEKTHSK